MAMSPYYVQYLLNQGDLLSRILSFNADFGAKQSSLRSQKDNDEIKDSLYKVHPQLAKFHEDHNISYYFENRVDRLCLLRAKELESLLVYLGACVSSNQLASVTIQEQKDLIYDSIGRETYEFALDYGYLIKNLDFMINLDNLKKDCIYLGLCALKCIEPLFSTKQLSEYFIDSLINFAKDHDLDPNIVTSKTHVLSVVYNTADLHQAPAPDMMNNPVQYTPVDNHPKLGKPTALELAIQEFDARAQQEREQAEIDTMAILAKARASVKAANMAKAFQERAQLVTQALAAHRALSAQLDALEKQEQEQKLKQEQEQKQENNTAPAPATSSAPVIKAKKRTLKEPLKKTVVKNVSSGPITPGSDSDDALSFLMKVQSPSLHEAETKEEPQAQTQEEAKATPSAQPSDNPQDSQEPQPQQNQSSIPDNQEIPKSHSAPSQELSSDQVQDNNVSYDPTDENEAYEQESVEKKAPVYGDFLGKDSRIFRVASLKQKNALKELSDQVNDPSSTKNTKNLEEEHLVTLDFNEHQVFNLTYLILYSQINENWYDYLKAPEEH